MDDTIKHLIKKLIAFRDERDWQQFHKPKDLAISLALEAAELLELFQWKTEAEVGEMIKHNWILVLSHDCNIDILAASAVKIEKNAQKYPVEKARGKHAKYTELTNT
jgi:NTP pyrophosphatase (non-canonical NTP hydrolase)